MIKKKKRLVDALRFFFCHQLMHAESRLGDRYFPIEKQHILLVDQKHPSRDILLAIRPRAGHAFDPLVETDLDAGNPPDQQVRVVFYAGLIQYCFKPECFVE
jgi:hypothetical protein